MSFNLSQIINSKKKPVYTENLNKFPTALPKSNIKDVEALNIAGRALTPLSLGSDGFVYCSDGAVRGVIARTNDGFATVENGFNFGSTEAGFIKSATKSKNGYVVVVSKSAVEADGAAIYYSTSFTSGYVKVLDMPLSTDRVAISWEHNGASGNTIGFVGEYTQVLNTPHKLYMTLDGGETWRMIKATTITDATKNSHWHNACYDPYSGKIFASHGDWTNSRFYVSADLAYTWTEITVSENDYGLVNPIPGLQPIVLIPTPNKIVLASDALTVPAIWSLVKDKEYFAQNQEKYSVKFELSVKDGILAGSFFPVSPFAKKDNQIYILAQGPTPGTKREMYIMGSGDNGESWHQLYSMKYDATYETSSWGNGIVGIDANGYMYAHHSYKKVSGTLISQVLKIKIPEWVIK